MARSVGKFRSISIFNRNHIPRAIFNSLRNYFSYRFKAYTVIPYYMVHITYTESRLKFLEPSLIREQLFKSKENNYEGEQDEGTEEEENEKTIEVVEEVQTEEEDAEINQRIRFNNILQKLEIGKLAVQV